MKPPVELGCPLCRTDYTATSMDELLPADTRTPCTSCRTETAHPVGAVRVHRSNQRCGATFNPHDRPRRAAVPVPVREVEAKPETDVWSVLFGSQRGDDPECE